MPQNSPECIRAKQALAQAQRDYDSLNQENNDLVNFLADIGKMGAKELEQKVAEILGKEGAKIIAEEGTKVVAKKIPVVGVFAGLGLGAVRALEGDFSGAALEVGSGLASTVPVVGTAVSTGIDIGLIIGDLKDMINQKIDQTNARKMAAQQAIDAANRAIQRYCNDNK
jgi:hypothetical protein